MVMSSGVIKLPKLVDNQHQWGNRNRGTTPTYSMSPFNTESFRLQLPLETITSNI